METISIEYLKGREGFDQIQRQDWDRLAKQLHHRSLRHEYETHRSLVHSTNQADKLCFLLISRGDTLIAICPVESTYRKVLGIKIPVLQNISFGFDFIWGNNESNKALLNDVIECLENTLELKWSAISFSVLGDSSIFYSLSNIRRSRVMIEKSGEWYYIDCNRTYDDLRKGLSRNSKHNLKQSRNRLSRLEDVEFMQIKNITDLEWAYEEFVELEASGWKGEGGRSIRQTPELDNYYRHLIKNSTNNVRCVIDLLKVEGKFIAGQLSIHDSSAAAVVKVGYDEQYSYYRPGVVLFDELVKNCCEDAKLTRIDTVNDSAWIKKWNPSSVEKYSIFIPRNTLTGMLYYFVKKFRQRAKSP